MRLIAVLCYIALLAGCASEACDKPAPVAAFLYCYDGNTKLWNRCRDGGDYIEFSRPTDEELLMLEGHR